MKMSTELDKTIASLEKIIEDLKRLKPSLVLKDETDKNLQTLGHRAMFGSKVEAMRQVILEAGETLYLDSIVKGVYEKFGVHFERNQASGIIRRYARDGRIFKAEGKNRFSLVEWSDNK